MAKKAFDFGDGPAPDRHPYQRPKSAASLVVADTTDKEPRFLMGQRSEGHVFMPGFLVFPGGRMERSDWNTVGLLPQTDENKIGASHRSNKLGSALLGCALRETQEETGISLSPENQTFRYLARAITPPGQVRRYDTRFFITRADAAQLVPRTEIDNELLQVRWLSPTEMDPKRVHRITSHVIQAALERLHADPQLELTPKTPKHRFRNGKPILEWE